CSSPTFEGESGLERGIHSQSRQRHDRRVRSGPPRAAPETAERHQDRRLSSRLASQRPPAGGLYFFAVRSARFALGMLGGSDSIHSSGVRTLPAIRFSSRSCTIISLSGRLICCGLFCPGKRTISTGRWSKTPPSVARSSALVQPPVPRHSGTRHE